MISFLTYCYKNCRGIAQEKPVTLFKHSDFTKSQIEYPEHIKDLEKVEELIRIRDN